MDMKKILQAMDGIATKPVVGSDSMAQFLRVVKEAELNQKTAPVTKPVPSKPVTAPSGNLTADEMVSILSGQKTQAQIMADREAKKADPSVKEELVDGSGNTVSSGNGQPVQTAQAPAATAVASTLSPEQLEYNRLRAQLDSLDSLRDTGGSQNVFVSRDPSLDAKEARFRDALTKMATSLKAKGIDAAAEYDAPEPGAPIAAPVDLAKKYATEEVGMSRFLSIMNEGKSPHKVALPVQMAMQHYQTPVKQAINETSSVFKTYVALVEDDISEKKIAKQQLIRQYSQRIAEAVLMKERVVGGEETPPGINRLTGKPNPPEAAPTDAPAVVPLGKRFDPRFKNGPEPYTIDIDGVVYKFAGRTATGPGTGEVIKVPAAVIGIRGLSAVSVELGKDGMYYPAPATNESKNIKR
jgi:hypothetical protein